MDTTNPIRIGTRASKLALVQAYHVSDLLIKAHPGLKTEIVKITTTGDKILEKNLNEIGGKGLFIKEIEEALLEGSIDIAVHSMKDVPAFLHDAFAISCILEREDPRDAFVSHKYSNMLDLPQGAVVGTSSPRRAAQLLHKRPDVKIVPFRGNIHTRLQKLENNIADATFLAMAGLNRSGMGGKMVSAIAPDMMLPAVAQGALGIEIRKDNAARLEPLLAPLHHAPTATCVRAERAFLEEFEGSCKTPIGALAHLNGDHLSVECLIASVDGVKLLRTSGEGRAKDAADLGRNAALELKAQVGDDFFASVA